MQSIPMTFSSSAPHQKNFIKKTIIPAVKRALPVAKRILPVAAAFIPALGGRRGWRALTETEV